MSAYVGSGPSSCGVHPAERTWPYAAQATSECGSKCGQGASWVPLLRTVHLRSDLSPWSFSPAGRKCSVQCVHVCRVNWVESTDQALPAVSTSFDPGKSLDRPPEPRLASRSAHTAPLVVVRRVRLPSENGQSGSAVSAVKMRFIPLSLHRKQCQMSFIAQAC